VQQLQLQNHYGLFSELMYQYPLFRAVCLDYPFSGDTGGIALSLNPTFKIVEVAYPYVAGRLLTEKHLNPASC